MLILAGDIGGTKTILTLVESDGRDCTTRFEQRFDSAAFQGLEPMVEEFLRRARPERPIVAACFAIAGPVRRSPTCPGSSTASISRARSTCRGYA